MNEQETNTIEMQCPICNAKTSLQQLRGESHYSKWPCSSCGGWFDFDPAHEVKKGDGTKLVDVPGEKRGAADKSDAQQAISDVCDEIKAMLLEKNRKYGNSALAPKRIFSRADPVEQINVRLDDKLSRIESRQSDEDEDPFLDLTGYLVLRLVAIKLKGGASEA